MATPGTAADVGAGPSGGGELSMEQLWAIARDEYAKKDGVDQLSTKWLEEGTALQAAGEHLRAKALQVQAGWRDANYQEALGKHLDQGVAEVERAMTPVAQAGTALSNLSTQLETTYREVGRLKALYDQALLAKQLWESYGFDSSSSVNEMNQLVIAAGKPVDDLRRVYGETTNRLDQAINESKWTGPTAVNGALPPVPPSASNPTATSPSSTHGGGPSGAEQPGGAQSGGEQPGGGQPGGQPGGGAPGGQEQPPGGQPPGGGAPPPGGEGPGGGPGGPDIPDIPGDQTGGGNDLPPDTGLSGNQSPGPPTLPKLPDSPGGGGLPPGGGVGGGGGIGPIGAGGPGGGGGGGSPRIDQAARNLTEPAGPGAGQAPSLAGRAPGATGGSAAGGMPPMMPPMMPPGTGAGGNGSGQPKPGTAPAAGTGRSRPAGPNPGVPTGLRGRAGNGETAPRAATGSRRQRRAGPQTVEMLDSELWEVDQSGPTAGQASTRQAGGPRPAI